MDIEQLAVDDRLLEEPMWCRYLVLIDPSQNHDKFYEVRIDLDSSGAFLITKHWGRRPWAPSRGATGTEIRGTLESAIEKANDIIADKKSKGYIEEARGV